ncbi:hypothetical protein ACQPZX_41295 [Actinoplanes sp. CA-142083]|uniref:hypothetical protein n=1 Tax=Actinoplanes sp. CA-142083 TaxID=3239903 RepID=UPI003D91CC79
MRSILSPPARPDAEPPLDRELEDWARAFVLSPAVTPQERHERFVVAQLLANVEALR